MVGVGFKGAEKFRRTHLKYSAKEELLHYDIYRNHDSLSVPYTCCHLTDKFHSYYKTHLAFHFCPMFCPASIGLIGSFSIDDGDGSENVTFKMNFRFFKLCRVYSNSRIR